MMFIVEDNHTDITDKVRVRTMNYGRDDLGKKSRKFIWKESIEHFLSTTEDVIDDFIQECIIEDKTLDEPDIPYLYELNYPSAKNLLKNHPNYFIKLIHEDEISFALYPFFDTPYIGQPKIKSGFLVSHINKIYLENDMIIFEGEGFFQEEI